MHAGGVEALIIIGLNKIKGNKVVTLKIILKERIKILFHLLPPDEQLPAIPAEPDKAWPFLWSSEYLLGDLLAMVF